MKRFLCLLCCLCLFPFPAGALVVSDPYIEAAFSLLDENNLFLTQYNLLGNNLVEARYPLGMPYFFGGDNADAALRVRGVFQSSSYYQMDRRYLSGLDCKGFSRWVQREAGVKEHDSLSRILYHCRNDQLLEGRPANEWPGFFNVGDLLVVDHGARHVLIYIGVPEDYGLTAENAPEIADYLRYPLFIHCGYNPFYYDRYKTYIEEQGYRDTYPPDGGVTVSIVGMERAPYSRTEFGHYLDYFMVWEQPLPIFHLSDCTAMAWVPGEK